MRRIETVVKDLWPTADVRICAVRRRAVGALCLRACAEPAGRAPLWCWRGGGLSWSLLETHVPLPALPRETLGTRAGGRVLCSARHRPPPPPQPTPRLF